MADTNTNPQPNGTPQGLDTVLGHMQQWRNHKEHPGATIPDHLWQQIFQLPKETYSPHVVRQVLKLTKSQYDNKYQQLKQNTATPKNTGPTSSTKDRAAETAPPAFCEAVPAAAVPPLGQTETPPDTKSAIQSLKNTKTPPRWEGSCKVAPL